MAANVTFFRSKLLLKTTKMEPLLNLLRSVLHYREILIQGGYQQIENI